MLYVIIDPLTSPEKLGPEGCSLAFGPRAADGTLTPFRQLSLAKEQCRAMNQDVDHGEPVFFVAQISRSGKVSRC